MKSTTHFILFSSFAFLLALFTTQKAAAAGWYDENWSYRRLITVPNPGSAVLSAFQVKIALNNSFDFTKAKTDGSDIRFTLDDGTSLIPFWIESWDAVGLQATIWIKVPSIPITGTYVYLYYGNLSPTIPPPNPFETPPVGPYTRATGNPIVLTGHPSGSNASLLAEDIVYDDATGHYWLVFADYGLGGVGLAWSNTPTNPASWTYHGNIGAGNAPHIIKEGGLWYIFSANLPNIVYRTSATINGTYSSPVTLLSPTLPWEAYRVDEPYVFKRNDGKWVMIYMADAGGITEQVGYAIADNITGPYTKFAGNPCIPFGPPGSFDAGTVADPWVYEYYGVYYVGYTVSPTKNSPWQTAVATTTDWQTFTKLGVILPASGTALDAQNSFRGAVTRIGNTYVFPYTNGQYRMSIATQPVYFDPVGYINNAEAVFDFFDGFTGTALNTAKWSVANGSLSQATVSGGLLTLTAPSDAAYIRILATSSFGMNYMGETYSRHPNQGVSLKIAEYGFADAAWNTVRIVDDFQLGTTYWQRQAKLAGPTDVFLNMAQTANQNWHIFHTYRQSPNIAGFQIDDYPVETVSTGNPSSQSVPTGNLPQFLMSYGAGNQIIVDWTRVRKWAGSDPNAAIGNEQIQTPALNITYYKTDVTCYGYSDGAIDISISGGSEPYTYLWTPGGQITQDITGIPAGSYSVLVTDNYLNTATSGVIVITQPAALLVNSVITNPILCSEGTATVLISATGGTQPYTGTGSFPQSVGTTVYNVTDAGGCQGNVSVTVGEPAAWYNESWEYRRSITVTNPNSTPLSDYQIMISLDNSFDFTKALTDGSDVRFTADDGNSLIPFWLETWDPSGQIANIWIKVPSIPVAGTSIYLYYGNPNPTIDIPTPIEVPPTGPFTRAVGNPIIPSGAGSSTSLLAENIIYDPVTNHYWMCLANYSQSAISLCYSDNPTDPAAWIWSGNVITTFTQYYSGAPHLLKHGSTWYLFYADRPHIKVATASNVAGPYTIYPTPMLAPSGPAPAWDNFRVDEPYVFFRESDSKWVIVYMGDSGGAVEQVGYATADNILGPYTAYSGNPCIAFGVPGSFDAGTIADPWVYKYHEVYYIGYTVSPTNASPWQTACATTTDWLTFTKLGVIFPVAISGWDAVNSFRGAITRIGDTYVFSYTGDGYKMGIATQPVYMTPPTIINNVDAVFDFYDGFDGTALNGSKWYFGHGNSSQASVSGGNLTLTHASGDYPSLHSQTAFGMNFLVETRARHPQQGTLNMVIETGFNQNLGDMVRLVDDFPPSIPNCISTWNRQAKLSSQGDVNWQAMTQTADQNWHVLKVFRQSSGTAGFQIDETPAETTSNSVPTSNLPVFLMSYTESSSNQFIVDWIRVRKYASQNPVSSIGSEQILYNRWTGLTSTDWNSNENWNQNVPDICSKVVIPSLPSNQPHVTSSSSSPALCRDMTIESGAVVTIDADKALTVNGVLTNNSGNAGLVILSDAAGTGSLIENSGVNSTIKRFLTDDRWHYISPPVDNSLAGVFMGIYMMRWNEPTGQWSYITDPNYVMATDMEGYSVWTYNPATVTFTGNINTGSKSFSVTNTFGALHLNKGYNFAGNPYPSSLDWNVDEGSGWTRTAGNVDMAIYIWSGSQYGAYVKGQPFGTNGVDNIIPPNQGFYVHCNAASGFIGVDNRARVHGPNDIFKSGDETTPLLKLIAEGNNGSDEIILYITPQATVNFDGQFDALKMRGEQSLPQLYSVAKDETELSINAFPESEDYRVIPLGFEAGTEAIYTISASELSGFESSSGIYLEDIKDNTFTKMEANGVYSFTASPMDEPMRFLLHMNSELAVAENLTGTNHIQVYSFEQQVYIASNRNLNGIVYIYDLQGRIIIGEQLKGELIKKISLAGYSGYYIVSVMTDKDNLNQKVFLK